MHPDGWPALSEFLTLPGAVDASGADAGTPAHYGNPVAEQRALAAGGAIVDLSSRAVLTVSGDDRLTWLDSLTSQSIAALPPGESAETLLLDPHGRVEHAIKLLDDGAVTWLLVERDQAAPLLAWLLRMRFMLRVEPEDRTADYATVATLGSVADLGLPVAAPNGVPLHWTDPWSAVTAGGYGYARAEPHPGSDWHESEVLVDRTALPTLVERVAAGELSAAGVLALEALRIAAWRPRFGAEVDDRSIPHEVDWLRSAVHLNKGCYRGQETVAKVHNLGKPPRRVVMLHLDGSDAVLPAPGSVVSMTRDGETVPVGAITSSAMHHELGPVALAVIKRAVAPDAVLTVLADDVQVAAAQEIIVPTDAGAVADVPRIPRLGRVTR
ncbi:CAF17-like 4Fe-4S cluster assembly/insertion protein YgfZ [Planctomonas psychrotolerans]|uniref:CAF17-like 4Fe-4S cluster assembly/insertion protein YgfZ n=1 Tax=Planctomonas psychrotolerans TaxID=2528712 RepID=UPI00123B7B66|nr:folate-binding protein YgfZ [Planctomonas psychrotolerans]